MPPRAVSRIFDGPLMPFRFLALLRVVSLGVALIVMASAAGAEEPRGAAPQPSAVSLVDTIAARHALGLSGSWDVLLRRGVIDSGTDDAAVVASLYALREGSDIRALLLVQRDVLPSASGWGAPTACHDAATQPSVTVYQSPRDVLCGWSRTVSFTSATQRASIGAIAATRLGGGTRLFGTPAGSWLWLGLRVSNRSDFLDIQLLVPNQPAIPQAAQEQFLADMAHSMDATWLTASLAAVPAPPASARPDSPPAGKSAPAPGSWWSDGSWWTGGLSASALKTATYRTAISVKTFMVASLMAGDAATGGAIITVLNVTSTSLYLLNDYVWETWNPLTQRSQDFIRLVDTK